MMTDREVLAIARGLCALRAHYKAPGIHLAPSPHPAHPASMLDTLVRPHRWRVTLPEAAALCSWVTIHGATEYEAVRGALRHAGLLVPGAVP